VRKPTGVAALRIVTPAGSEALPGELGEIWVRGRNTMTGYWKGAGPAKHDAKGLDRDGWMHTGDLARRDAEGFVTIVDRLHDMIVSGGFKRVSA
jgi:acyl-CoA synthetase (AMP-forming)/AMP-acid ligase II